MEPNRDIRDLVLYTSPKLGGQLQNFRQFYALEIIVDCPDESPKLLPKNKRLCRFCKRGAPFVKFSKIAHKIPELLGNRNLVCDFECDSCNTKFGEYESALGCYTGPIRSFYQVPGKKPKPHFHAAGDALTIKQFPLASNSIKIEKKTIEHSEIEFDERTGETILRFRKNPYKPFDVYKSFLKIGISCIKPLGVIDYANATNFLVNSTNELAYQCFAKLVHRATCIGVRKTRPFVFVFKKKRKWLNMPTHIVAIYFQNVVYQFCIPNNRNDKLIYGNDFVIPICPPLSADPFPINSEIYQDFVDLSSNEKELNDVEICKFKGKLENVANTISVDFDKKVFTDGPFDMGELTGIVLVPPDTTISLKDFTKKNG